MKYQIDQSGKVEQTQRITIVAFSNGKSGSVSLSTTDKKTLLLLFRKANKPKLYSIQIFASLVFLLIRDYKLSQKSFTIDIEYPGYDNLIRSYIIQLCNNSNEVKLNAENIRFKTVGKSSNVHKVAYKSFKRKKAEFKSNFKEINKLVEVLSNQTRKKSGNY